MPFPECQRVIYKKNPLGEVICQLIFPPILKIDTEVPVAFQERVRNHFPNFSEVSALNLGFLSGVEDQIQPEPPESPLCKNYEFSSEDQQWKINLTRSFVSLSTKQYTRWESFKEKLKIPFDALHEAYTPAYFLRVGLRYTDVFNRTFLNFPPNTTWDKLLQPCILGIMGSSEMDIKDKVKNFVSVCEIGLSDGESNVKIKTALVKAIKDGEICFMIDSDFYNTNKTTIDLTLSRLDFFNSRASRLIQWCIKKELHNAMEPQLL